MALIWYFFILQVHKYLQFTQNHYFNKFCPRHWSLLGHAAVVYVGVLGPGHAALLAVAAVPGVAAVVEPALALVSGPITAECGFVSTNHSSPGHVGEEAAVRVVLTQRLAVPGLGHLASSRVRCHVSRVPTCVTCRISFSGPPSHRVPCQKSSSQGRWTSPSSHASNAL